LAVGKKTTCLGTHGGYDLCYSWIQNGQNGVGFGARILLIVLEHPVSPVNISGPEAPQAPQLVSNWRGHDMVIPFGRWIGEKLLGETTLPDGSHSLKQRSFAGREKYLGGNWLGPSPARHSHEKSSAMAAPPTHASGRQKTLP